MRYFGTLYAIDPGTTESAFVRIEDESPAQFNIIRNSELLYEMKNWQHGSIVVIEKMSGYGKVVGDTTFDTIHWSGRFHEALWRNHEVKYLTRQQVKLQILGTNKGTDAMIRQELVSRFGEPGRKADPGLLYGMKSHQWQALALGVAWIEMWKLKQLGEQPIHEAVRVGNNI